MGADDQRDLRLVGSDEGSADGSDGYAPAHGDLVANVIRETGLLPAEKIEQVRKRAAGASFSHR